MFRERESREKESHLETGNPTHEWTTVNRRKTSPHRHHQPLPPLATQTTFIKFLPTNFGPSDIANIFHKYGPIIHITIPKPLKPNHQYQFAFVKFMAKHSLHQAILNENGRRIAGMILKVEPAKSDTKFLQKNPTQQPPQGKTKNPRTLPNTAIRDHRSYKEVSIAKNHPKQNPQPAPQKNPQPGTPPPTYQTSPSHVYLNL